MKSADKKYSRFPHSYEITFYDNSTTIEEADDQGTIPQGHFDFIAFDKLKAIEKKNGVDIIGVVKSIGEPDAVVIKPKNPGEVEKHTTKKDVVVLNRGDDGSVIEASVTIWGDKDIPHFNIGDTVIFTALSKKEFKGGLKLSSCGSTKILPNFDIPECHEVREFFSHVETPIEEIKGQQLNAITEKSKGLFKRFALDDLDTVTIPELEAVEKFKSKTFYIRSHFIAFKNGPLTYAACPNESCFSKKLKKDDVTQVLKCPSCQMTSDEMGNVLHKYLTSVTLSDYSGSKSLVAFDKGVGSLLFCSAETFDAKDEQDKNDTKTEAQFKCATYCIRAGIQNSHDGGQSQVRFSLVGVKEAEWEKEAKGCLGTIGAYCRTFGI